MDYEIFGGAISYEGKPDLNSGKWSWGVTKEGVDTGVAKMIDADSTESDLSARLGQQLLLHMPSKEPRNPMQGEVPIYQIQFSIPESIFKSLFSQYFREVRK
jgi:hypothetical protein